MQVLVDQLSQHTTLSINGAGVIFEAVAGVATEFMAAFGMPVAPCALWRLRREAVCCR